MNPFPLSRTAETVPGVLPLFHPVLLSNENGRADNCAGTPVNEIDSGVYADAFPSEIRFPIENDGQP